jgi:hypothetical protein
MTTNPAKRRGGGGGGGGVFKIMAAGSASSSSSKLEAELKAEREKNHYLQMENARLKQQTSKANAAANQSAHSAMKLSHKRDISPSLSSAATACKQQQQYTVYVAGVKSLSDTRDYFARASVSSMNELFTKWHPKAHFCTDVDTGVRIYNDNESQLQSGHAYYFYEGSLNDVAKK